MAKSGDVYTVTLRDLDRVTAFQARPVRDGLEFERRGRPEVLRAADGNATGMKWLAGKQDCLMVQPGEGFCRD